MKYMLLIQHGDTPTPGSPEWEAMSEDEKRAVATDYQAINQTGGVTPGSVDGVARCRDHGPRLGRRDADHRRARSSP